MIKKWLRFYILLLIGLLGFIPNFSNAELNLNYSPFTLNNNWVSSQYIEISNDLNFITTDLENTVENILYIRTNVSSNWTHPVVFAFGWKDWRLYWFYNFYMNQSFDWISSKTTVQWQWFLDYYALCSNWPCWTFTFTPEFINNFIKNNNFIWLAVENWASVWQSYNWILWPIAYSKTFCFISDNQDSPYLCFAYWRSSQWKSYYSNSLNYNVSDWNDILSWEGFFDPSPFKNSWSSIPDYEFNEYDDFTNQQIIDGYNAMGLTDEFCYWWFGINDIFPVNWVPSEFTWYRRGGGASIFDIWSIYSWSYNNDYKSFLWTFYLAYNNQNYSEFYFKPKALYGFFNQWFSVSSQWLWFIEATAPTFTFVDIWEYCDIKFYKNPNSLYTWSRRDPKFRYYSSWQVNLWGYFNFSWNNQFFSWSLSWFNTPRDFFASLNAIFQWWFRDIWNHDPLLPEYILIFLFAIILIRMISH